MIDLLRDIALGVVPIAAGVALLLAFGRPRPGADVHDVADYHPNRSARLDGSDEPAEPSPAQPQAEPTDDVWADWYEYLDTSDVPWTPPYADLTIAQVLRRYGDNRADIAHRMLAEIGREKRAELEMAR